MAEEQKLVRKFVQEGLTTPLEIISAPLHAVSYAIKDCVENNKFQTGEWQYTLPPKVELVAKEVGEFVKQVAARVETVWKQSSTAQKWTSFKRDVTWDLLMVAGVPTTRMDECFRNLETLVVTGCFLGTGKMAHGIFRALRKPAVSKTTLASDVTAAELMSSEDPRIIPGVFWRGAGRDPDVYFREGFHSRGWETNETSAVSHTCAGLHVPETSGYISVADNFALASCYPIHRQTQFAWVYEIHSKRVPLPPGMGKYDCEHLFPRRIFPDEIKGAWKTEVRGKSWNPATPLEYVENPLFGKRFHQPVAFVQQNTLPVIGANAPLLPNEEYKKLRTITKPCEIKKPDGAYQTNNKSHEENTPLETDNDDVQEEQGVSDNYVFHQMALEVLSDVTGVNASVSEIAKIKDLLTTLATCPKDAPLQAISGILNTSRQTLESVCNFPKHVSQHLKNLCSSDSLAELGYGCYAAVAQLLTFMDGVSWICEFVRSPKSSTKALLTAPYQIVKHAVNICRSLLRDPKSTCKALFRSLVKMPQYTIKRFLSALGLRKRRKKKKYAEPVTVPELSQKEKDQLLKKYANDLQALYFLARSKGFIDPFCTIPDYHDALYEDWVHSEQIALAPQRFFDFPLFIAKCMYRAQDLFAVRMYSPRAHPDQPILLPGHFSQLEEIENLMQETLFKATELSAITLPTQSYVSLALSPIAEVTAAANTTFSTLPALVEVIDPEVDESIPQLTTSSQDRFLLQRSVTQTRDSLLKVNECQTRCCKIKRELAVFRNQNMETFRVQVVPLLERVDKLLVEKGFGTLDTIFEK